MNCIHAVSTAEAITVHCWNMRFGKIRNTQPMARSAKPTPPVALGALDAYLMSTNAPAYSMGLSDPDGFLTRLAVSPELILPSDWRSLI